MSNFQRYCLLSHFVPYLELKRKFENQPSLQTTFFHNFCFFNELQNAALKARFVKMNTSTCSSYLCIERFCFDFYILFKKRKNKEKSTLCTLSFEIFGTENHRINVSDLIVLKYTYIVTIKRVCTAFALEDRSRVI